MLFENADLSPRAKPAPKATTTITTAGINTPAASTAPEPSKAVLKEMPEPQRAPCEPENIDAEDTGATTGEQAPSKKKKKKNKKKVSSSAADEVIEQERKEELSVADAPPKKKRKRRHTINGTNEEKGAEHIGAEVGDRQEVEQCEMEEGNKENKDVADGTAQKDKIKKKNKKRSREESENTSITTMTDSTAVEKVEKPTEEKKLKPLSTGVKKKKMKTKKKQTA